MADITALTSEQIQQQLQHVPGWAVDGSSLVKTFTFDNYPAGLMFAVSAGMVGEGLQHHPDMTLGWCKVSISLTTHDAGSQITAKDFAVAQAIEALPYP